MSSKKVEIANSFKEILRSLDLDLEDDNLKETPQRVARMYVDEVFSGLDSSNEPNVTTFENSGDNKYTGIVLLKDISCYSMCSHHFLPFSMNVSIAYVPKDRIVGISKLARIAKHFSRKPQTQENLTEEIADYIVDKLDPQGVAVIIEGKHFCMVMRGVENETSKMTTSTIRGIFKTDSIRKELYSMLED